MIEAIQRDFKFGALLQRKSDGEKVRVLKKIRGDEFTSIHESVDGVDIAISSRYANHYYLLEDGSNFKPTPEFLALI